MAQGQIFDEQDYLRIKTTVKLLAAEDIDSAVIRYKTPAGTWGEFSATHNPADNTIYYDLPQGTTLKTIALALEEEGYGLWTFRGVATMNDGRKIPGTLHREMIYKTES